jgi:8-oxo-dGTP pyrophosphatase MutT (NUDIX family)
MKYIGTFLFYLLWPVIWFIAPLRTRVRVLIVYKNEVLVVKNWFGPSRWQLPGGGMKFGEDILSTAKREIKEELSFDIKNPKNITSQPVITRSSGILYRYSFVLVLVDEKPQLKPSREITETAWKSLEQVAMPQSVRQKLGHL